MCSLCPVVLLAPHLEVYYSMLCPVAAPLETIPSCNSSKKILDDGRHHRITRVMRRHCSTSRHMLIKHLKSKMVIGGRVAEEDFENCFVLFYMLYTF